MTGTCSGRAALALLVCAGACADRGLGDVPGTVTPGSRNALRITGRVSGPGAGPASEDFAGWESWTPASKKRFRSVGHGGVWVDIFVAPPHAGLYDAGRAPVPEGFRVAKATYDEAGKFLAVAGMRKMASGYDADNPSQQWRLILVK